jgi:hypothetical protein
MNEDYKPPFVLNYWRPWEKDSNLLDSWLTYNKDISLVQYNAGIITKSLNKIGAEQRYAIDNLSKSVTGGFAILGYGLNKVYQSIQITNNRLDKVIQTQLASNILLGDIKELLKIPEREKERIYRIESALKFLRKAKEDKDLYDDAYQEFKEAEKLKAQDYFTLYNIGTIELYSEKHLNISSAKSYFEKAAKYAMVDTDNEEYKILNDLFTQANNIFHDNKGTKFISSCLLQAAFCCYILGDDDNAFVLAHKAAGYAYADSYYYFAKYSIRKEGYLENAIFYIDKCLKKDIKYLEKINADFDFISNPFILEHLKKIVNDIENRFSEFELKYKGKSEFCIYKQINERLNGVGESVIDKFNFLQKFSESYISLQIAIENQNKEIQVNNKKIDTLIIEKQNEISTKESQKDLLEKEWEVLHEKMYSYQRFSEDLKGSPVAKMLINILTIFALAGLFIVFYRIAYWNQLNDQNNLLLNPFALFFEILILSPLLGLFCRFLGKEYYKGKYEELNSANSEYDTLTKKRKDLYREIEEINDEIKILRAKKQKQEIQVLKN